MQNYFFFYIFVDSSRQKSSLFPKFMLKINKTNIFLLTYYKTQVFSSHKNCCKGINQRIRFDKVYVGSMDDDLTAFSLNAQDIILQIQDIDNFHSRLWIFYHQHVGFLPFTIEIQWSGIPL